MMPPLLDYFGKDIESFPGILASSDAMSGYGIHRMGQVYPFSPHRRMCGEHGAYPKYVKM